MLQATWMRIADLDGVAAPLVVASEAHRFTVAAQLLEVGCKPRSIILEPVGRNTAPAIAVAALAALAARAGGSDPLLLALPSDHVIARPQAFLDAIAEAAPAAEASALVAFGITPTKPETGYGYLRLGAGNEACRPVAAFIEKPDRVTAEGYLAQGGYVWNSGMFLFRASRYLEELGRCRPDILAACEKAVSGAAQDADFLRLGKDAFLACPAESIDYAVMEKTGAARVLPIDVGWSDVGSWSALWDVQAHDADGNAFDGDVVSVDCHDTYVRADKRLVSVIGLDDVVVVDTDDALLVARKSRVQDVRQVVKTLKDAGRSEATIHRKVYRPWGAYDSIDASARFQVKRLTVKPGAKLSLQMHHHRAEHWVVVSGTARVTRGDETFLLTENESTFIPIGTKHRLENPGVLPLEVIEVQSGSYLGEDDIVRFQDVYGRVNQG